MQQIHSIDALVQWLRAAGCSALRTDSRQVGAGDAFIAWPGAAVDARRFVAQALAQGAVAALVEQEGADAFDLDATRVACYRGLKADAGEIAAQFYGAPSQELAVLAVTGTNGKTSTAWWLAQALSAVPAGVSWPCGVIGTLGVGRPPHVQSTGLTTPDPVLLQQTLRQMADQGLRACAMEASSIGIEEHRLAGTRVRIGLFTNFTQDHLDYHHTMQAYWQAKRKLFDWPGMAHAVVNVDDVQGAALALELTGAMDVWTISTVHAARLAARNVRHSALGMHFDVVEGDARHSLQTQVIGQYNVSNLLGVIAAMRCLDVPLSDAVAACAGLLPVPGRMECVGGQGAPLVAIDYAHTPDALSQALQALRPLAKARGGALWVVFGCGGDRDASKRPLMGAMAARHADRVVVTSDNPRSERPDAIVAQILLGLIDNQVDVEVDRAQAILGTVQQASDKDVVLLAGKGHEDSQEVAGIKHPFSDRQHALAALQRRGAAAGGMP